MGVYSMIKPVSVKPLENYMLDVVFSTGERKLFDVKPYFSKKFYEPLQDKQAFQQVYIGDFTVEWANGRDIAPHELYDNAISR